MRPDVTGFHGVEVSHHKKSGAIIRLHNCDTVSEDGGEGGGSPLVRSLSSQLSLAGWGTSAARARAKADISGRFFATQNLLYNLVSRSVDEKCEEGT